MPFHRMAVLAAALASAAALAQSPPNASAAAAAPSAPLSSAAERVFEASKPRIVQVRTLLQPAGRQSVLGSGFLVTADGLAVTNYHVVSQFVLEPKTYRLEYLAPDGGKGPLAVLAIDVAHDLAIVKLDRVGLPAFTFDARSLSGVLPKGERIYAMGNPLDLGFTIVEGTYNGLVDKSFDERIHFSGAINPGMSGGPVANAQAEVVGINVAKQVGGESVGFLVPARHAAALLERARRDPPLVLDKAREEVGRQLEAWQAGFYSAFGGAGFRSVAFGPYTALESTAPWMTCWANTNAGEVPKPRAAASSMRCSSGQGLFVSDRILTGRMNLSYTYYRATELNAFQFSEALETASRATDFNAAGRRLTPQECHDQFVETAPGKRPPLRATWCMRGYREFEGLYDVTLIALTQDRLREALLSRLSLQGVSYANALATGQRFLEAIGATQP